MTQTKLRSDQVTDLRRQAEEIAGGNSAQFQENLSVRRLPMRPVAGGGRLVGWLARRPLGFLDDLRRLRGD